MPPSFHYIILYPSKFINVLDMKKTHVNIIFIIPILWLLWFFTGIPSGIRPIDIHAQVKTLTWVKSWTFGSWAWTPRGAGFWWPPAASVPRRRRRAAQRTPNARGASATWFQRSQHVWFVWSKNSQNIWEEWVLIHPQVDCGLLATPSRRKRHPMPGLIIVLTVRHPGGSRWLKQLQIAG